LMVAVPSPGTDALMNEVITAANETMNLELLDPRPRAEILDLIDHAVAVVSTSDFEGMPNVFVESWTRGVPALALSYDPDGVIERYGLGAFAGGSRERFLAAASALWRGRAEQSELGARCRAYVEAEHSEDVVVADWQRVLGIGSPSPGARVLERVA
jgi:glycosyltransferase involved in cell wall biosynthesis